MTPEENRKRLNQLRAEEAAQSPEGSMKKVGRYDKERRRQAQVNKQLLRAVA